MKRASMTLAVLLAWPAALSAVSLLESAKENQGTADLKARTKQQRRALVARRTKDLAKSLNQAVSSLEEKGLVFERVQGDSFIHPLPEIGSKVALERHRTPPRLILKPKANEDRIYFELTLDPSSYGYEVKVTPALDKSIVGKDLRNKPELDELAPRLQDAVLRAIAAQKKG